MNQIHLLSATEIVICILGGAFGALAKDCLKDNTIELPFVKQKKLYLGFIGALLIGGFIGLAIDGSFFTAAMGGYTGSSLLANLLPDGAEIKEARKKDNK